MSLPRLRELAALTPGMPLSVALQIIDQEAFDAIQSQVTFTGNVNSPAELGQWAYNQSSVMAFLDHPSTAKKINAIKELRSISYAGLKESKEAVEYICYTILGWPKPTW